MNCWMVNLLGIPAVVIFVFCLLFWCANAIRRDWMLSRGNFLLHVIVFVISIPFALMFFLYHFGDVSRMLPQDGAEVELGLFASILFQFFDPGQQGLFSTGSVWLSVFIAVFGLVFLNGLLISTLINWFDKRRELWEKGEVRYSASLWFKKYAVVIGANETAPAIIKKLLAGEGESRKVDYVLLLTHGDVESLRTRITSYLSDRDARKLIIYRGQLDSIEEIAGLKVKRASEIYVLGESPDSSDVSQSYHDIQNMKCVHNIASVLAAEGTQCRKICHVLFEYQTTYSVFQFSDIPQNVRDRLVFIPYNNYENWAQRVLVYGEYRETVKRVLSRYDNRDRNGLVKPGRDDAERIISYTPLDGAGICSSSKEYVHFIVVGMSKMGVAMAIQAAQIAHFPNYPYCMDKDGKVYGPMTNKLRTRITFIDEKADNEMNFFKGRYQHMFALARNRFLDATDPSCSLSTDWNDPMDDENNKFSYLKDNFIDVEWEFIKGNVQHPKVKKYLEKAAESAGPDSDGARAKLTIAVCHPLAHEAIAAALYMPGAVYDHAQQILVYQREASEIVYNLYYAEGTKNKRYSKLRPFGMQEADFSTDKTNYYRAQMCNYTYTLIFDDNVRNESIPEVVQSIGCLSDREKMTPVRKAWKDLTIFNKWSNRYLSNSFETKLRSCGIPYGNNAFNYEIAVEAMNRYNVGMAISEHNRWNVQQLLMGFRPYTKEENERFLELRKNKGHDPEAANAFSAFKKMMKNSPEKAHLNICSFEYLSEVDPVAKDYDEIFNVNIPLIFKMVADTMK